MKLKTEEQIYKLWDEYTAECTIKEWLPTKNMWLDCLDITRPTYNIWKKKSNAIKKIDGQIENMWVQNLTKNNVAGTIFYLKNAFGYRDRQELDHTSGGKSIPLLGGQSNGKNNTSNKKTSSVKEKD